MNEQATNSSSLSVRSDQPIAGIHVDLARSRTVGEILTAWVDSGLWARLTPNAKAFAGIALARGRETAGGWLAVELPSDGRMRELMGRGKNAPFEGRRALELLGVCRPSPIEMGRWFELFAAAEHVPRAHQQLELSELADDRADAASGSRLTGGLADDRADAASGDRTGVVDEPPGDSVSGPRPNPRITPNPGNRGFAKPGAPGSPTFDIPGDRGERGALAQLAQASKQATGARSSAGLLASGGSGGKPGAGESGNRGSPEPGIVADGVDELLAAIEEAGLDGPLARDVVNHPHMTPQIVRSAAARCTARGKGPAIVGMEAIKWAHAARRKIERAPATQADAQRQREEAQRAAEAHEQARQRDQAERQRSWARVNAAIDALSDDELADLEAQVRQRFKLPPSTVPVRQNRPLKAAIYAHLTAQQTKKNAAGDENAGDVG